MRRGCVQTWCLILLAAFAFGGSGLSIHRMTAHAGHTPHVSPSEVQDHPAGCGHHHHGEGHRHPAAPADPDRDTPPQPEHPDHEDDCSLCLALASARQTILFSGQVGEFALPEGPRSILVPVASIAPALRTSVQAMPRGPPAA
ncbi:MAG: hypothetical protein KIT24_06745 [Phycisphaeraceae bacterium]|nr:hypothetical protein [Phycisphaeraceae bacterium]